MAHGLGGIRQMRLDAYAERFAAAGYACLVSDYRHFGARAMPSSPRPATAASPPRSPSAPSPTARPRCWRWIRGARSRSPPAPRAT
ncbi:hypothetical protein ACQEVB_36525 [Pseudonocardia sp. CA-107938]|uniref:hypothetical protein n=1 Tax=Pseudonocardia sp. CA-107938 TaxID=3240021 RepID=UPI003D8DD393